MNKFAQLLYGKVIFIYETNLKKEELSTIFSPATFWVDVTGLECEIGYTAKFDETAGIVLVPPETDQPQTIEEKEKYYTAIVQDYMDTKARERRYDDIKTAVTYENSADPTFKSEAKILREWRDKVWRTCYTIMDDIKAGKRQEPENAESLIAELPELDWGESV